MNLKEMMDAYQEKDLARELAAARVCQDIVLKAIAEGPLNRNVTIKGGVVMRSMSQNSRRATRDIDIDFIHYSLSEESIRAFVQKLNCINGVRIEIDGDIQELKHQDYHGKSIGIMIRDDFDNVVRSKIDIGVHKHIDIEQEEYCFDVCMDDEGASLLKNTPEQAFVEKLRSLLVFGPNSRRYKDIYDMFYLKDTLDSGRMMEVMRILIFDDAGMREESMDDICKRVADTFANRQYLNRASTSRQRWMDEEIEIITNGIQEYLDEIERSVIAL